MVRLAAHPDMLEQLDDSFSARARLLLWALHHDIVSSVHEHIANVKRINRNHWPSDTSNRIAGLIVRVLVAFPCSADSMQAWAFRFDRWNGRTAYPLPWDRDYACEEIDMVPSGMAAVTRAMVLRGIHEILIGDEEE